MKPETYLKFKERTYSPGDWITFYIGEITKDSRIILTEESPAEKKEKIEKFLEKYKDKSIPGEVAAIMSFGIIVNVDNLSGIIPNKEFRKAYSSPKNFIIGDKMLLKLLEIREDDKLVFTFWIEKKEDKEEV